jgi:hypothetical protein
MATPRVRATVKAAAAPSSALDLCGSAPNVRSSSLGADTVCKSRNSFADALQFTQGLMADHFLCEGAVCTRVSDHKFSGGATPHREAVWLRALEVELPLSSRPKLIPRQPAP